MKPTFWMTAQETEDELKERAQFHLKVQKAFQQYNPQHECPTCGGQCRCDVPREYCVHCAWPVRVRSE